MKRNFVLLLISLMFPLGWAQTHPNTPIDGTVDVMVGDKNNVNANQVYSKLIDNAPTMPQYSSLPKFAIIGKNQKFYLSIGATMKSTANFDWGNPLVDYPSLFVTSAIGQAPAGSGGNFDLTAKRSRISFNFVGLPDTKNELGLYFSLMFDGSGNNYAVQVNHAYAKFRGFTIGYKLTMYCDQAANPYTIDGEGPNSSAGFFNSVVGYERNLSSNVKMGVGLEVPMQSITTSTNTILPGDDEKISKTNTVTQRLPDIPIYIQYNHHETSHIRLSGIFRNIQYRDLNIEENKNKFGWGLKLSGNATLGNFIAYYMGQFGYNVASYMQDNQGLGLDLTPSMNEVGKLDNTHSWGAFGAIQYNINKNLFCTAIYSHLRNYVPSYNGGTHAYDTQYRYGQYIVGNVIWSPNKYIQTGIEYLYGRRVNFDYTQNHANRLMAMFAVAF